MAKTKGIYGWHFLAADGCIAHGPFAGEEHKKVESGIVYSVTGKLELCEWGLHASIKPLDALQYAPGPIACYVRLSGDIVTGDDKVCASNREVIAMVDATDVLRDFIRDTLVVRQLHIVTLFARIGLVDHANAIRALNMERAPFDKIESVMVAAWDAARDAAWAAAWAAAWDAARAAAWDAARDAARVAAWDAAWDDLNARLETRLFAAMGITR